MKKNFSVIGAGFSGAVLARQLADAGHHIHLFESRAHLGGNCYTERDKNAGVMVHRYGPHIFHTENQRVWEFVNRYVRFRHYTHSVKTTLNGGVFQLPINLHTINQFYQKAMSPSEARNFIQTRTTRFDHTPGNFEEQALAVVGRELYEAFLKGYTRKHWGIDPKTIPAAVLNRLPVRFNYDNSYYNHPYQGIPEEGYTPVFEKLLHHNAITLHLNTTFSREWQNQFDHCFFTGPLDDWFANAFGRLAYRTLHFEEEVHTGDYQGCPQMNFADETLPFTRITEHKHFAYWEQHEKTVIFREFSRSCEPGDIPYYPIRLTAGKEQLKQYVELAQREQGVSFLGRLGTYRYLDMDMCIKEAINASEMVIEAIDNSRDIPVFFQNPLL
ncbi:MAG TPA: UDP-galactopyranose mutase [Bacteroidales bacterium]|nr:UDP-galactopyranose mutase [Bacteroidales bacterium]